LYPTDGSQQLHAPRCRDRREKSGDFLMIPDDGEAGSLDRDQQDIHDAWMASMTDGCDSVRGKVMPGDGGSGEVTRIQHRSAVRSPHSPPLRPHSRNLMLLQAATWAGQRWSLPRQATATKNHNIVRPCFCLCACAVFRQTPSAWSGITAVEVGQEKREKGSRNGLPRLFSGQGLVGEEKLTTHQDWRWSTCLRPGS
jgi:hypothetical protein